ncbi:uncharacterized protein [Gossypium hirsutum]|uniref:Reverse transcriptase domain-containing protein n=1 Tax=Gossypium hirsutum TaxID=3635 RepID=A0A1U8KN92_GOSHI|nr:uncharacterized protein LOC107917343 [Gossypium hirsutum]
MRLKLGKLHENEEKYWAQRKINERLMKESTDIEIKEAFNQMDPRKALGDRSVDRINETIIDLIPKIKEPIDMTNFRSISLCRVVSKIMAKVLVNRLKETLPKCISQNQSAFVPGRMIYGNILIAHKLVYYLQSANNGSNKGFMIKLDMSKAVNSWSKRLLSYGGKEVLLKATLQSIPTCLFCFSRPVKNHKGALLENGPDVVDKQREDPWLGYDGMGSVMLSKRDGWNGFSRYASFQPGSVRKTSLEAHKLQRHFIF